MATGVAGYFIGHMPHVVRAVVVLAGILMVAPGMESDLWALVGGLIVYAAVLFSHGWLFNRPLLV